MIRSFVLLDAEERTRVLDDAKVEKELAMDG